MGRNGPLLAARFAGTPLHGPGLVPWPIRGPCVGGCVREGFLCRCNAPRVYPTHSGWNQDRDGGVAMDGTDIRKQIRPLPGRGEVHSHPARAVLVRERTRGGR